MERAGLIRRQAFAEVPLRVEYALTSSRTRLEAWKPTVSGFLLHSGVERAYRLRRTPTRIRTATFVSKLGENGSGWPVAVWKSTSKNATSPSSPANPTQVLVSMVAASVVSEPASLAHVSQRDAESDHHEAQDDLEVQESQEDGTERQMARERARDQKGI